MGGGGKNQTSTQSVSIPPEVLARYGAVNQRAENVAQQPFKVYSTDPSAFVQPLTSTQQSGITNTNAAAGQAQPYYDAAGSALLDAQQSGQRYLDQGYLAGATGLGAAGQTLNAANANASPMNTQAGSYYSGAYQGAQPYNQGAAALYASGVQGAQGYNQQAASGLSGALSGAQPYNAMATGLGLGAAQAVNPDQLSAANINQYMSPYLDQVLARSNSLLDRSNAIEQSGQLGSAIRSGAGSGAGDRAGIAAANLAMSQELARGKINSDILNQGYGQALSTAQQQQGVGLGAGQANRAALGSAAQQLAAIGQQTYGQGTGTAQAQAGLGQQVYGQEMGAGQAVQGLGQQVYGQGTGTGSAVQGLGQQVFGQGLATSQQQQSLAQARFDQALAAMQAQYGMGSSTSQQLAGLGAGAQGAALQGAQAQMAAGSAEQQTGQAGKQALYNQFLQEQSYPFQVAQFLANIAMGTGSLSGSTTTTTQPGGFFSDERLKENIREVGKTYDGQPIVTYSYKDEPNVIRMGMIAQDVQKKHPEAVGEKAGFKTVDYGAATDDAAKRGKFAYGGSPTLPGLGSVDYDALMRAQQGMVTPYGGGLYGGASGGMPNGGTSYVPEASVAVSPLAVAGGLTPPTSPFEQVAAIADAADTVSEGLGKAKAYRDKKRAKKASGGALPYENEGLDIPNEKPGSEYELKTADSLTKGKSGLSNVKDAASTALSLAKLAAMFKDGGAVRKGYAAGGNPFYSSGHHTVEGDREAERAYQVQKRANLDEGVADALVRSDALGDRLKAADPIGRGIGSAITGATTTAALPTDPIAAATSTAGKGLAGLITSDKFKKYDPARIIGNLLTGKSGETSPALPTRPETVNPIAAHPVAPRPARAAPVAAPPAAGLGAAQPAAPVAMADPITAPGMQPAPEQPTGLTPPMTPPENAKPHGLGALGSAVSGVLSDSPVGGYFGKLKHGDGPAWMSLLAGIGAMGTAPTVHPGVALAAGLSGGVKAYQGAKETAADIAKTQAETATERQQPARVAADTALVSAQSLAELNRIAALQGMAVIEAPDGKFEFNGKRYSAVPKASLIAKGPGVTPAADVTTNTVVGPEGQKVAQNSYLTFGTLGEGAKAEAQSDIGKIAAQGTEAQRLMLGNREWGSALSHQKDGLLQQGAFNQFGRQWVNVYNSAVNLAPLPAEQKAALAVDPEGLTNAQIAAKMTAGAAQLRAAGADQRSLGAIQTFLESTPNQSMTRDAAMTLWANEMVRNQQDIDIANYMAGVDSEAQAVSGQARNFLPSSAMQAFWKDNPSSKYDAERNRLSEIAKHPNFGTWMGLLQSGDERKASQTARLLDAIYGPGMARYLTGGQ